MARQSGGGLAIESAPGRGTTVTLYLPRMGEETGGVPPAPGGSEAARSGGPGRCVLLVEDEEGVRRLVRDVLEGRGHRVREAANGREALELLGEGRAEPDLLVTDVVMPQMGGVELAEEVSRRLPSCRVLFVSGYAEPAAAGGRSLPEGAAVLPKPFSPSELLRAVERVLEPPAAR